jgi:hypothetical protein
MGFPSGPAGTMKKYIQAATFAALAGATCAPIACGSKSGSALGGDDTGSEDGGSDGSTSSGGSAGSTSSSGSSGGSSGGAFMTGDSSGGMGTGTCKTGMYSGTFSCLFYYNSNAGDAAPGPIPDAGGLGPITGNLSFLLTQSISGELGMDTASGMFVLAAGVTMGSAQLNGTLDCGSGTFNGALSGGMYNLFNIFTGPFEGPLTSQYSGASFSFVDGTWSLTIPGEGYCPGTWTASYDGPGDAGEQ